MDERMAGGTTQKHKPLAAYCFTVAPEAVNKFHSSVLTAPSYLTGSAPANTAWELTALSQTS